MMKEVASRHARLDFPKRFAGATMLAGLTKAIRSQGLPRLLGFQGHPGNRPDAGPAITQPLRAAPVPDMGHPSARDFILMAQAARMRTECGPSLNGLLPLFG